MINRSYIQNCGYGGRIKYLPLKEIFPLSSWSDLLYVILPCSTGWGKKAVTTFYTHVKCYTFYIKFTVEIFSPLMVIWSPSAIQPVKCLKKTSVILAPSLYVAFLFLKRHQASSNKNSNRNCLNCLGVKPRFLGSTVKLQKHNHYLFTHRNTPYWQNTSYYSLKIKTTSPLNSLSLLLDF